MNVFNGMHGWWQDLREGIRRLRKNAGYTAVAVSSLGLGLALTASILAVVNAYLLRSLPYPTSQRLYHVRYAPPGPYEPRGMTGIDWKTLDDVVEDSITASGLNVYLIDAGPARKMRGLQVSPGFIRGLGIQPVAGRSFTEEEFHTGAEAVVMISHALWRDQFGLNPEIVRQQVRLAPEDGMDQVQSRRVIGVLPPGFWYGRDSSAKVDLLTPQQSIARTYMVRLRRGVPVEFAERRITEAAKSIGSDFRPGWAGVQLQSVHDRYVEGIRPVLVGVTIAIGTVLVLVCLNVAVLNLLHSMRRQKEIAVRLALGARRKHLARMLAAETCLIGGAALVLGLAIAGMMLPALGTVIEGQLGRPAPNGQTTIQLDPTVLLILGFVTLVITLGLAFLPLLTRDQRRLANLLRSQGTTCSEGPFTSRLRAALVSFEVAGSLVLLVGCGLMVRSAVNLTRTDLGFDPERVFRVGLRLPARTYPDTPALYRFFSELSRRLPSNPDSQLALMTAFPPFYPANTHRFEAGEAPLNEPPSGMLKVGPGYFSLYRVALRQGREFTTSDRPESEPVAMISETLARRLWPNGNVLGRQIRVVEGDMPESPLGVWRTVVGVVRDLRQGYDDADFRDIYLPFLQSPSRFASVHVRTGLPTAFWEERVRSAVAEINPHITVGAITAIVSEDRQKSATTFLAFMLSGFAAFATGLALLGIYGITTYIVQQREREIAIRSAVGADRKSIVGLFLRQGARILMIGVVFGLFGTVGAVKILRNMLYGVQALDATTLIVACGLITVFGLLAVWWPVSSAAARNPVEILKEG